MVGSLQAYCPLSLLSAVTSAGDEVCSETNRRRMGNNASYLPETRGSQIKDSRILSRFGLHIAVASDSLVEMEVSGTVQK